MNDKSGIFVGSKNGHYMGFGFIILDAIIGVMTVSEAMLN